MITGRDLIMYILSNGLENEPVFKDGKIFGFLSMSEVADKMNVGPATVWAWIVQGRLPYIQLGGFIYIPANFQLEEPND